MKTEEIKTFAEWLKDKNKSIPKCNCGGPQYGTAHSPDCEYVVGLDILEEQYDTYVFGIRNRILTQ